MAVYTIEELRRRVAPIAEKHGVARVMLFGSYARGEATEESDVDFRIDKGRIRGLLQFADFKEDLEGALGKDVDVVSAVSLDGAFASRIMKEWVMLFMDSERRNIDILRHIEDYCLKIGRARKRFGDKKYKFLNDEDYQLSCAMSIMQIGELSSHLTDAFRQAHSELPWRSMKAMRNVFAHDYEQVDIDIVWQVATTDVPELLAACERILEEDDGH